MTTAIASGNDSLDALMAGYADQQEKEEDPLGRDAFLTMLVAQMQNQNPLNPMEGTDFSGQLAQFSQLEQLFNIKDGLDNLNTSVGAEEADNLIDYIGKEVESSDNSMLLLGGIPSGGRFTLDAPAEALVKVFDESGNEIKRVYSGNLEAGVHDVNWNGTDLNGNIVPDGIYGFQVMALNNGQWEAAPSTVKGLVDGVTYENGFGYLTIDGKLIDPSTVSKIYLPGETKAEDEKAE